MKLHRGDVILARLPFSDGSGFKIRPALVVQSDHNNARLDDVILALITSSTARAHEATQLLVDVSTPEGRASGLLHSSTVKCEHLVTLHRSIVQRVIGRFPPSLMTQINACLQAALGLS